MTQNPADIADSNAADPAADPDAAFFAEVTSGIYRRVVPESVWSAIQYAVRHRLPAENPTIMLMLVRIAEYYPSVREYLLLRKEDATADEKSALELCLNPPREIRDASYLPDDIQSPGEMDLCWAEFLVTGSTEPVEKVIAVLDRPDLTRPFLESLLLTPGEATLELGEKERAELASMGIAVALTDGLGRVASPGDIDILMWFGLKNQIDTCSRITQLMDEDHLMHIANKGAAVWSLQANANQHGMIRAFCEQQSKITGGIGRTLIVPQ